MKLGKGKGERRGVTTIEGALVALVLIFGTMAFAYLSAVRTDSAEISSLQSAIAGTTTVAGTTTTIANSGGSINETALPVMNQTNTIRQITETWYLSTTAHQDRFDPDNIVVNQGDTLDLTLIDNDTVAHDFVIGPPYNIVVNATVPGLVNDITQQTFTTPAKNNSPGVVVEGTPGNVTATFSFVAKYAGIFEFVCTYHAEIGMIGYLTVLPDSAYTGKTASAGQQGGQSPKVTTVDILQGSGANASLPQTYSPDPVTVVIGVNNTVTWVNNDTAPHTVTANDGSFDSGNIAPTGTFTFTFTTPGTYHYHCIYHPWMVATVIVKAG
jgi:plastocyanin